MDLSAASSPSHSGHGLHCSSSWSVSSSTLAALHAGHQDIMVLDRQPHPPKPSDHDSCHTDGGITKQRPPVRTQLLHQPIAVNPGLLTCQMAVASLMGHFYNLMGQWYFQSIVGFGGIRKATHSDESNSTNNVLRCHVYPYDSDAETTRNRTREENTRHPRFGATSQSHNSDLRIRISRRVQLGTVSHWRSCPRPG